VYELGNGFVHYDARVAFAPFAESVQNGTLQRECVIEHFVGAAVEIAGAGGFARGEREALGLARPGALRRRVAIGGSYPLS
jgi:hypothetical protein